MTKPPTPSSEAPPRSHAPVDPLNMQQPIWVGLYQTPTRNVWEVFTGPDARERACDWADAAAQGTPDRKAVVFGPQCEIFAYTPPRAMRLDLVFGPVSEAAE